MKLIKLTALFLLLFSAVATAQVKQLNKIKKELKKVQESKEFKTGFIGFCLMDAESGKVLVESNSQKSFVTASAMKLVTTGAALALLGDTFRFKTQLYYIGEIKDSILYGYISISGSGDPSTGSDRWDETNIDTICQYFVKAIKALGIKKIDGDIQWHTTYYIDENIPPGFTVGDLPTSYGGPPFDLNYRENYFSDGFDTIRIPDLDDPEKIHDTIIPDKYSAYNPNFVQVERKPADLFVNRLEENLELAGIKVEDEPDEIKDGIKIYYDHGPGFYQLVTTHYSKPLLDISTVTNQQSVNLYAESILRSLDMTIYRSNNLDTCINKVRRFWKKEVGDLEGLRMTDGSGLSRSNLCTPQLFCKMLSSYTKRDNFDSFYSTMAVAGKTGTVAKFGQGTAIDGNARIKTGTMTRVKSFVGYVTGKDGRLYAFALMFNNFESDASPTAAASKIIPLIGGYNSGKKIFKVKVQNH